jgi:hypothetical protein
MGGDDSQKFLSWNKFSGKTAGAIEQVLWQIGDESFDHSVDEGIMRLQGAEQGLCL